MATNIFVYWLDGLGDRAFDHHTRNGGGAFANKNWPGGGGGGLVAGIDPHINFILQEGLSAYIYFIHD